VVGWEQRKSERKPNFDRGVLESVSEVGQVTGFVNLDEDVVVLRFCGVGVETNFLDGLRARAWQPATHECWNTSGQATHAEILDRLFKRRTCRVLQS
jgi:hypothetical protein